MAEYIEKDRLYKMVAKKEETARNWVLDTPANSPAYMRYVAQLNERTAFKQMVADIPAVNVVEVRHGRWIANDDYDGEVYYTCSRCEEPWVTIDGTPQENRMKYCPNCGADMREES